LQSFALSPNGSEPVCCEGSSTALVEAAGIAAGVIGDNFANNLWKDAIRVVVFRRDLEEAIKVIYGGEIHYEDYQDDMTRSQFDNLQACNRVFCDIALKCHPEVKPENAKLYRDVFAQAKDALDAGNLDLLEKIQSAL
jgi:hypothetical protein